MSDPVFADERFFHLIVQASPAGMVIADEQGTIVLANAQAAKIFGYPEDGLVGLPVERLIPQAHAGVHASHRARYLSHPEPRPMALGRDLFAQRQDGSQVAVDISLHPIETGGHSYVLANILDATERRRLSRQQETRESFERLALMGQLAGGVAHEIRTPLCVIRNNVYYLRILADKLGEEGAECLDEIDQAIGKAERIVSELLDFTRDGPCRRESVLLGELVDLGLADVGVSADVEISRSALDPTCRVHVDPEQVTRVLANLFRNAVEAIGDAGMVEVRSGEDNGGVWIEIGDDGPGISPTEKEQVFEPLYTTKPTGIGLGLALSRRYAESNGGSLIVTDNVPRGACFRLTLPGAGKENGVTIPESNEGGS